MEVLMMIIVRITGRQIRAIAKFKDSTKAMNHLNKICRPDDLVIVVQHCEKKNCKTWSIGLLRYL